MELRRDTDGTRRRIEVARRAGRCGPAGRAVSQPLRRSELATSTRANGLGAVDERSPFGVGEHLPIDGIGDQPLQTAQRSELGLGEQAAVSLRVSKHPFVQVQ